MRDEARRDGRDAEETVTVYVVKYHTYQGEEHQPGESYEVPAAEVDNLVGQGLVTTTPPPPAEKEPRERLT